MLPASRRTAPVSLRSIFSLRIGSAALALACAASPAMALAQAAPTETPGPNPSTMLPPAATASQTDPITLEADAVSYDDNADTITASGNVVLRRSGQSVRSNQIVYDRKTGTIVASGNVRAVDADGNQLYTEKVELTDELKAGAMQNLLLALRAGGRLAANSGQRLPDGTIQLTRAAYTACAVEDSSGCPRTPSWRITASRVIYDPDQRRVSFRGARLELFGLRLLPLPGLVVTTDGRPINGLLIPDIRLSASNGVEFSDSYYLRLADNQDLSLTGHVFTQALPMISAQYRALTSSGAFQVTGYATRSRRIPIAGINPQIAL